MSAISSGHLGSSQDGNKKPQLKVFFLEEVTGEQHKFNWCYIYLIVSVICRPKGEFAKVEQKVEAMSINPSVERHESFAAGHRGPRNGDKKDHKWNTDRADAYRLTRREDNRRVARDMEKPQEQPRPEPETWRKPVEPPKLEVATPRFGKAATALELAQAFSTSMSDTAPQSRLTSAPSPRVPPSPGASRDQSGFSRLTDSRTLHSGPSQRKINGY
jgi:hypothetical protein